MKNIRKLTEAGIEVINGRIAKSDIDKAISVLTIANTISSESKEFANKINDKAGLYSPRVFVQSEFKNHIVLAIGYIGGSWSQNLDAFTSFKLKKEDMTEQKIEEVASIAKKVGESLAEFASIK